MANTLSFCPSENIFIFQVDSWMAVISSHSLAPIVLWNRQPSIFLFLRRHCFFSRTSYSLLSLVFCSFSLIYLCVYFLLFNLLGTHWNFWIWALTHFMLQWLWLFFNVAFPLLSWFFHFITAIKWLLGHSSPRISNPLGPLQAMSFYKNYHWNAAPPIYKVSSCFQVSRAELTEIRRPITPKIFITWPFKRKLVDLWF